MEDTDQYDFPSSRDARMQRLKLNSSHLPFGTKKEITIKRLMRDFREVEENRLETVYARPLEDNILEWHANLIGTAGTDYEGVCFHLIMKFPVGYPEKPPEVELKNYLKHGHVYGEWICLDMLQSWRGFTKEKHTGWSSAYSVNSILLQLQAFLFAPQKDVSLENVKTSIKVCSVYSCRRCPHNMKTNSPWPFHSQMIEPISFLNLHESNSDGLTAYERDHSGRMAVMEARKQKYFADLMKREAQREEENKRAAIKVEKRIQMFNQLRESLIDVPKKNRESYETRYIPGFGIANQLQKKKKKKKKTNVTVCQEQTSATKVQESKEENKQPKKYTFTKDDLQLLSIWNSNKDPLLNRNNTILQKVSEDDAFTLEGDSNKQFQLERYFDNKWRNIPPELLEICFSFMNEIEIRRMGHVCSEWSTVTQQYSYIIERRNLLQCFHTKLNYIEDVLGIGVSLEFYPKSNKLSNISTPMDIISYTAFYKLGVRKGVWQHRFTHFVPLYISKQHYKKAMKVLVGSLYEIYDTDFISCEMALDLFCKLMNSMIVSIMNGEVHASIKALQGYCFFHRMLIALVQQNEKLRLLINERVKQFLTDPEKRIKKNLPSLGDFLPLLSISDYSWKDIAGPVLSEVFDRNVLWITKEFPSLAHVEKIYDPEKETEREKNSFQTVKVSLRLIMFHVYFLNSLTKLSQDRHGMFLEEKDRLTLMAEDYDLRYGLPTLEQQSSLQKAIFEIQNVSNYKEFFAKCQVPVPSDYMLHKILRNAVFNSQRKRYHHRFFNAKEAQKKKNNRLREEYLRNKGIVKKKEQRAALNQSDDY
jgi:ubiquitin-protein ligase